MNYTYKPYKSKHHTEKLPLWHYVYFWGVIVLAVLVSFDRVRIANEANDYRRSGCLVIRTSSSASQPCTTVSGQVTSIDKYDYGSINGRSGSNWIKLGILPSTGRFASVEVPRQVYHDIEVGDSIQAHKWHGTVVNLFVAGQWVWTRNNPVWIDGSAMNIPLRIFVVFLVGFIGYAFADGAFSKSNATAVHDSIKHGAKRGAGQ